jgi:FtsP/CotA-like multicopper oxidase with cupredoxin domain
LTANTGDIDVGGYKVKKTEHYNDSYLTPVIEALPGDIVAAHLVNSLEPRTIGSGQTMAHAAAGVNPTNLHYFHGGIVSPQNDRPKVEDTRDGHGDNIYVWLKNGVDSNAFDFKVPIPGKDQLDARVLEGESGRKISHPEGLNWYHSRLHGFSSDQVIGGMSGLLSVGDPKANVKAACKQNAATDKECLNDVDKDTTALKD